MSAIKNMASNFQKLLKDFTESIKQKRQRTDEAAAALRHAHNARLPPADVAANVKAYVARVGDYGRHKHSDQIFRAFATSGNERPSLPWQFHEPLPLAFLCAADPDGMAAALLRMIPAEYESGSSAAERPSLIARLEQELAAAQLDEETAIDEAIAAGLQIEQRPEVVTRRQREAEQAERDRKKLEWDKQQAEKQAEIDARHGISQPGLPRRSGRTAADLEPTVQ